MSMNKEPYTRVYISITMFTDEGVITASSAEATTRDPDKPVELPFVPAE